jgi:predicted metal-dependent hydrolase
LFDDLLRAVVPKSIQKATNKAFIKKKQKELDKVTKEIEQLEKERDDAVADFFKYIDDDLDYKVPKSKIKKVVDKRK